MMAHNINILFSFTWNIWWQNIDELQVVNLLKELFIWKVCSHTPILVNSTYWVISTPFISHYRFIRGITRVEILGRQKLQTIFVELRILLLFYGIKHCIGELSLRMFCIWWIRALTLVIRFKVTSFFYLIFLWIIQIK